MISPRKKARAALALAGMLFCVNAGAANALEIPFLEKAPALTGRLDDQAWSRAAAIGEFGLYNFRGAPRKNTSVRLAYDTEFLYVGFECASPAGSPVRAIVNQEMVDMPVFDDDCVEIFLVAGDQEPRHCFHIAASARGIRWDGLDEVPELWDGRWEAVTGRGSNAWTAEFKIPFQDLALAGRPQGTPATGTVWRMNFARAEKEHSELSQWSPSKHGFADPAAFRPVTFGARPAPWDIDVRIADPGLLSVGSGSMIVEAGNLNLAPIEFTCSLARKTSEGWKSKVVFLHRPEPGDGRLEQPIPYEITQGGEYRLLLETTSPKTPRPLHVWAAAFSVAELDRPLQRLAERTDRARQLLARMQRTPVRREGLKSVREMEKEAKTIRKRSAEGQKPTAADWADLQARAAAGAAGADHLVRRLQRQAWKEEIAGIYPGAEFCVGIGTPFEQIFQEDLFAGPINQPIRIQCARNEMEDAQIVMIPLVDRDMEAMTLEMSDLKAATGEVVLPSRQWWIGAVGYIERPRPANADGEFRAFWPDVLLPAGPVTVNAGKQQPVFLRVTVPADQPAGLYRGRLTVKSPSTTQSIPVELEVWNFTLPKKASLQTDSWMTFRRLGKYYQVNEVTLEQYERILKDFQGYRLSLYPFDYIALGPKIKLFREPDGSLSVDFTEFDPYFDLAIRYGATAINLNLSSSGGMQTMFAGGWGYAHLTITDRATGKVSPYPAKCRWPAQDMYEDPDFIAFWQAYWRHAQQKGWDAVAYVEDVDEPNSSDRKAWLLHTHAFFRRHCPGLPLLSFGPTPLRFREAVGFIDWWAPILWGYDGEADALRERQKAHGERVWVYTCGNSKKNLRGYSPDTFIHTPLLDKRIVPLMCWKFGIQGLFQFTFNSFDGHADLMKKSKQGQLGQYPILHAPPSKAGFGIANLTWPGPELCQLLPSLRLEMKRDGMEDYEYLALLRGLRDELNAAKAPAREALIEETDRCLSIPDALVTDVYDWSHDPADLLAWRARIAGQIVKLRKALEQP